jgi:hypothetical protein
LSSLDGVANEGASGDNWIYRIDGKLGRESFGSARLNSGGRVQWTFGEYRPE